MARHNLTIADYLNLVYDCFIWAYKSSNSLTGHTKHLEMQSTKVGTGMHVFRAVPGYATEQ